MTCDALHHKYKPHPSLSLLFCELCGNIVPLVTITQSSRPLPKEIFGGEQPPRDETNRETANRLEAEAEAMSFEQEIDALMQTGMSFEQAVDAITERVMRENPQQQEMQFDAGAQDDGNPRRVTVDDADDDRLVNTTGI